jgi:hypothetical protein
MLGCVSQYNRQDHTFIGGEIGHFIKKVAEGSGRDLALIRYEKRGTFVIIEFVSPNRDVFIDIQNLGRSLANFTRAKKDELLRRLYKPMTCDEVSRFITDGESRYLHDRQDDNAEEWEREERLARGE